MNFKELFDKYKAGQASPEEIEIVESEIEKNELINEYLADNIDDELFKDTGLRKEDTNNKDDKILSEVQRAINKKLRKLALYAAAIVIAMLLALQFVVSPLVDSTYYNPNNTLNYRDGQLFVDSAVYTELHFPGIVTSSAHAESLGFGKYNIKINQWDIFKSTNNIYEGRITRSRASYIQQDFYKFPVANAFSYGVYPFEQIPHDGDEAEIEELRAMPKSAIAKVYVSFKEDLSIDDVVSLMNDHKKLKFSWVAVRTSLQNIQQLPQFGFEPTGVGILITHGTVDPNKYPCFELAYEQSNSPAVFETHFKSLVRYMGDNEDFVKMLDMNPDTYERVLNYVEKSGVKSYGVLVIGSPDEILGLMENPAVYSIMVDNIKLSSYSK